MLNYNILDVKCVIKTRKTCMRNIYLWEGYAVNFHLGYTIHRQCQTNMTMNVIGIIPISKTGQYSTVLLGKV